MNSFVPDNVGSCDTMVSVGETSARSNTVFGKNSDRPAEETQPLELHCDRSIPQAPKPVASSSTYLKFRQPIVTLARARTGATVTNTDLQRATH